MKKSSGFTKFLLLSVFIFYYGQGQEDSHSYIASFDSSKIAYTDEGSGEVVLLLHGFISNGSSWSKSILKKELLREGYRVIIPDLRGNGKSDRPENPEAYEDDAEVRDLIALVNHLKLKDYKALGYSRGAIVLSKLLTKESRIDKAIIGGMGADFTNPNWSRRIAFADAFSGRAELNELTRGAVEYAKSIDANLKILGLLQDYQPITSPEELREISIPVLIVCGDKDKDNGSPKALQKLIPNSTLRLVQGDHNNTYKQANFAEVVLKFLKEN